MKTKLRVETAVVGVSVEFNHAELIALKGFIVESKALIQNTDIKKLVHYEQRTELINLFTKSIVLLEKICPNDTVCVSEAIKNLFLDFETVVE